MKKVRVFWFPPLLSFLFFWDSIDSSVFNRQITLLVTSPCQDES